MNPKKVQGPVIPAKAGIQKYLKTLDSRLRGNDANGRFMTFYETVIFYQTESCLPASLSAAFSNIESSRLIAPWDSRSG